MKQAIFLIMATILLESCATSKQTGTTVSSRKDSIRTEVRKEIIYIPDTVLINIPAQSAERTTKDSTSHLENDYAESDARINPNGSLYHDLKTKPQDKPVPTEKEIIYRDSIVYVDKEVEVPMMVEKDLTAWQEFRLKWFNTLVAVLLALLIWTFRTSLKNLIRRFI